MPGFCLEKLEITENGIWSKHMFSQWGIAHLARMAKSLTVSTLRELQYIFPAISKFFWLPLSSRYFAQGRKAFGLKFTLGEFGMYRTPWKLPFFASYQNSFGLPQHFSGAFIYFPKAIRLVCSNGEHSVSPLVCRVHACDFSNDIMTNEDSHNIGFYLNRMKIPRKLHFGSPRFIEKLQDLIKTLKKM